MVTDVVYNSPALLPQMGQFSGAFYVSELPRDQDEARLPLKQHLDLASSTVYLAFLTSLLSPPNAALMYFLQEYLSQALPQGNPTEDRYRGK